MKRHNQIRITKQIMLAAGVCPECGLRLSNPLCEHATPEQREYTIRLDAQIDAEYERKTNRTVRNYDSPDPVAKAESDRTQQNISDGWEKIKEVKF